MTKTHCDVCGQPCKPEAFTDVLDGTFQGTVSVAFFPKSGGRPAEMCSACWANLIYNLNLNLNPLPILRQS